MAARISDNKAWSDQYSRVRAAKRQRDVEYLIATLRDPEFRKTAARYLGKVGDQRASEPLIRLLDTKDEQLQATALDSLGQLRVADALPRAKELLADGSPLVRTWAVAAIARIEGANCVEQLIALLDDDEFIVRRSAAAHLGELGDPRAIEPLRRAKAKERWRDRARFRQALRRLGRS